MSVFTEVTPITFEGTGKTIRLFHGTYLTPERYAVEQKHTRQAKAKCSVLLHKIGVFSVKGQLMQCFSCNRLHYARKRLQSYTKKMTQAKVSYITKSTNIRINNLPPKQSLVNIDTDVFSIHLFRLNFPLTYQALQRHNTSFSIP